MAKSVVMVAGSTGTGSTTDITSSGIGTIDGAILLIVGATSDNSDTSSLAYAFALYDGSTLVCASIGALDYDDYGAVNDTNKRLSTGAINCLTGEAESATGTVDKITDGLRISWSNSPSASYRYRAWLLYGGHTLKVGTQQMSGTLNGTASYTGASFTPQAGIFASVLLDTLNSTSTLAQLSLGAFTYNSSTITQRAICYTSKRDIASTLVRARAANAMVATLESNEEAEITAVASDGFTVTTRTSGYAAHLGFMLFGRVGGASLFDANVPASTGVVSLESPGFQPDLVMMVQSGMDAYNTNYTSEHLYLTHGFATSGTSEGSASLYAQDGALVATFGCRMSAKILGGYTTSYADDIVGDVDSFDALGLNINYTTKAGNAAGDIGFCLALLFTPTPGTHNPLFFGAGI